MVFDLNDSSSEDDETAPVGNPKAVMDLNYTSSEGEEVVAAAPASAADHAGAATSGEGADAQAEAAHEEAEKGTNGTVAEAWTSVHLKLAWTAVHVKLAWWAPSQNVLAARRGAGEAAGRGVQDALGVRIYRTSGCSLHDFHGGVCESIGVEGKRKRWLKQISYEEDEDEEGDVVVPALGEELPQWKRIKSQVGSAKHTSCPHGRRRSRCKECGGNSICQHGRQRSQCKECGGGSICQHGRRRSRCKECGGSSSTAAGADV